MKLLQLLPAVVVLGGLLLLLQLLLLLLLGGLLAELDHGNNLLETSKDGRQLPLHLNTDTRKVLVNNYELLKIENTDGAIVKSGGSNITCAQEQKKMKMPFSVEKLCGPHQSLGSL